ncbi:MAG: ComF family protein [Planctomycetales bacterium]|nr:ComF family protein [Planctomycetales bacterium]
MGLYEGELRDAVIRCKQARFEPLALGLGRLLGGWLRERVAEQYDLVIPVPSHWMRRWTRGTHSAGLLAERVSCCLGVPQITGLRAVRRSRKQGTLSAPQRFANVRGVFRPSKRYDFHHAKLLLIDDVMTTGATLGEAARVLKRAGAAEVCAAVIARGTGMARSF